MNYKERFASFYNSPKWKALRREIFIESDGLCQDCLERGRIVEGKEVHHIIPIEKDWSKRFDKKNLILLCSECHRYAHDRTSSLQDFNRMWERLENQGVKK